MPEWSTIVTVLAALTVPVATLIGVAITQRNNRKMKQIELQHQSELKDKELTAQEKLKSLELQEENHRILRAEKRSIYGDILKKSRHIVHYWDDVGRIYWHPVPGSLDKPLDPNEIIEDAWKLRHYYEL